MIKKDGKLPFEVELPIELAFQGDILTDQLRSLDRQQLQQKSKQIAST